MRNRRNIAAELINAQTQLKQLEEMRGGWIVGLAADHEKKKQAAKEQVERLQVEYDRLAADQKQLADKQAAVQKKFEEAKKAHSSLLGGFKRPTEAQRQAVNAQREKEVLAFEEKRRQDHLDKLKRIAEARAKYTPLVAQKVDAAHAEFVKKNPDRKSWAKTYDQKTVAEMDQVEKPVFSKAPHHTTEQLAEKQEKAANYRQARAEKIKRINTESVAHNAQNRATETSNFKLWQSLVSKHGALRQADAMKKREGLKDCEREYHEQMNEMRERRFHMFGTGPKVSVDQRPRTTALPGSVVQRRKEEAVEFSEEMKCNR